MAFEYHNWQYGKDGNFAQYSPNNDFAMLDVPVSNADGSKTPTGSLINNPNYVPTMTGFHDGFSNGDVYASEEVGWDFELVGSLSTSPTSVRTPDDDTFERDLNDFAPPVRNFYHQGGISPQSRQGHADVMDMSAPEMEYFNAFNQDPQPQYMSEIARQLDTQNLSSHITPSGISQLVTSQPYNQLCATAFTQQPPQQDPWSPVRQSTNSNVPRSDSLFWDPESDITLMGQVGAASANFDYLLSPHSPGGLSLDSHCFGDTIELQFSIPNSSLANYSLGNSSGMFSDSYVQVPRGQTSPEATSVGASSGHSPYQPPTSPYVNIPSPQSDGVFSYQASDPGSTVETAPVLEHFHNTPSPILVQNHLAVQQQSLPDPSLYGIEPPAPRTQRPSINRPGGRQLGSHLKPEVAKDAHDMRKVVACWHCVLQRDKCGPGDVCDRCLKRSQRPNAECGLGCSRVRLWELASSFLPSLVTAMHENSQLTNFVALHIRQWSNIEVTLRLTCGQGLPYISCKVYEFAPKTQELLRQFQYTTNPGTGQCICELKKSPPLGMIQLNHKDEQRYDRYINEIVDNYLGPFGYVCFVEEQNEFQQTLFLMMTRLRPKADDEIKLLREVFRLIVVTYIMGHTLTIEEDTRDYSLKLLRSYRPGVYADNCSPRMTNRQLKYFFCRLHQTIMTNVLNKLQQIFKSSKGCDKWTSAFCAVLGLAMAHEDNQKTIHLVTQTKAASHEMSTQDAEVQSTQACEEIDGKFSFIMNIFRWKYNRGYNPLRDSEQDWMSKLKDPGAIQFARDVSILVTQNTDYLAKRQHIKICTANQTQYTSRLVAKFLLSFWLPS
ncbi:hypothetical protein AOQ84DRAFT_125180 [Glonium stellatum]|uniref:Zn(2)-C6 fungal-type domain-containing protein n=1 Tax=Glonium stellatum TaxID=574774 RepID=A0A8E2F9P6_9PEZI|nr:hypothetical protein AOQ84DRAFT_125180 [Glonium stellatum]